MAIFSREGVLDDVWTHLEDEQPIPGGAWTVSARRWLSDGDVRNQGGTPGIRVQPDMDVEELAGHLDGVQLVVVHLPKFKDGRAFTQARLLRSRLGFQGEIRATGPVIPDQLQFLYRCGVDTIELPEGANLQTWQRAMSRFETFYQPGIRGSDPVAARMRHSAPS